MKSDKTRVRVTLDKERGFILITSYLLFSVLAVFTAAMFTRAMMFYQATERNKNRIAAFNLADSGLDTAITQLREDPTYAGTEGTISMGGGAYSVQVCPPSCDGLTEPTNDDVRVVKTIGYAPGTDSNAPAYENRTVLTYVELGSNSLFNFAVFSDQEFDMTGNANIDSYNSNDGDYDAENAGSNGDIGTNGTGDGDVSLTGNAVVNGGAQIGPDGDTDEVIELGENASITGDKTVASSLKTLEDVTTDVASSGELKIAGDTVYTLGAGTYHFSSIDVTGNAQINCTGAVTIYVDDGVKLEGNGVSTSSNKPPNFVVYVMGDEEVKIGGNGSFYGAIYAPNSHVKNHGNGEVFGAIVAETYQQTGNGNIHYDEALDDIEGSSSEEVNILTWQEYGTTAGAVD